MPGNGWCTHPKRQLSSGVKLLVRGGELACRNSWGGDLFQSKLDDAAAPAAAADLPGGVDEVTSVTIPQTRQPDTEDRVVSDRPAPRRPVLDPNDAAHRDQDERARIMARGSRDALAQARQRLSSRRRPALEDDVVADDNIDGPAGGSADRVITHQARFSDRFLSPTGLPDMRAEPVPREEVERRAMVPRDRFDTVPEIDPNFGLDEPEIPVAAVEPEPPVEPTPPVPPLTEHAIDDEIAQTSYEHVLQRARRIRASKMERMRPIRHADLLPGREQVAPEERWIVDAPAASVHDTAPVAPEPGWQPEPEFDDPLLPEAVEDDQADSFDDEEQWQEDEGWDEDAEWDDADAVVAAPRRTWLNRLGFGQRSPAMLYDDATVTRHAEAQPGWDEADPLYDDDPSWDEPVYAEAERGDQPARTDVQRWPDAGEVEDDLPAWRTAARPSTPPVRWPDPLPATREPAVARPAPRAGHDDAYDVPSEPSRAAAPFRPRTRGGVALPDLDDALFDAPPARAERAARSEPPVASARHEPTRTAAEILDSRSPRDSYFRSSRFQEPEERQPRFVERDIYAANPAGFAEPDLPDLDAERIDVRDAVARGDEQVARRIEVAPDVPRQCRTCRSFRSADGGTRGWCTNEYAFTHRRMVNDDDLACDSSIGCWWLPADDWRLDLDAEIDESPTPRMDALIARNRPAARRAAGE